MNLETIKNIALRITPEVAQSFVHATRNVVDAVAGEVNQVRASGTPGRIDYSTAQFDTSTPVGGWLSHADVRQAAKNMNEAIAAEKWQEGFVFAVQALAVAGVI